MNSEINFMAAKQGGGPVSPGGDDFAKRVFLIAYKASRVAARHYKIDESDADDILGDAIASWVGLSAARKAAINDLDSYLKRIVWNKAKRFLTRRIECRGRNGEVLSIDRPCDSDEDCRDALIDLISGGDNPLSEAMLNELRSMISHFLESLPKEHRKMWNHYLQGMKYREIAKAVGGSWTTGGVGKVIYDVKIKITIWLEKHT